MRDEFNKMDDKITLPFPVIGLAVCVGSLLTLGVVILIILQSYASSKNTMQSYIVGEATKSGYIGIKITYDKEPVDVILYDPTGRKYLPESKNAYYKVNEDEKTVVLLADSDKLGIWSAQFNTKSNKKIDYCMIETPSKTPYITEPSIYIGDDGQYYLKFTTTISETKETTAKCNITLNKLAFAYGLKSADIMLNEEAHVLLQFPDHVFTNEDYRLKIKISTESNQTASTEVKVHLNAREDKPSEENEETMSTEKTTSAD